MAAVGSDPLIIAARWCGAVGTHSHTVPDEYGEDYSDTAGGDNSFHYLFFYRASDAYQNGSYADGFRMAGTLFTSYTDHSHGPWTTYIPPGTDVSDLRLCSIWTHLSNETSTIVQRVNYEALTIWEVDSETMPDVELYTQGSAPIYQSGFTMGGNNPF